MLSASEVPSFTVSCLLVGVSSMAGLGRRTHYRKHLTDSVLHDLPEPNPPHSRIAKIVATRGSNQFDVLLANGDGKPELAILPTKFRKLVWLKRNDYVIVETAEDESSIEEDRKETTQGSSSGGIRKRGFYFRTSFDY